MLQIVLLVGKFVLLLVLYIFIYQVVRSSSKEFGMSAAVAREVARAGGSRPGEPRQGQAEAAYIAGPSQAPAGATWRLSVVKSPCLRPGEVFTFPPGVTLVVGRAPDMDIVLDDTFVSAKHAVFEATDRGFQVEDLHSTNGTLVNGQQIVGVRQLQAGDRVEIGDTIFQVEVG